MDSPLVTALIVVVIAFFSFRMIPRLLAGVPFIDPEAVQARMEDNPDAIIIDVRTPEEFATGHVPESLNVEPVEFGKNIEEKRKYLDTKIYLICLSSQRAAMAAKSMKSLGFTNVSVVKGGINLWRKKGLPLT